MHFFLRVEELSQDDPRLVHYCSAGVITAGLDAQDQSGRGGFYTRPRKVMLVPQLW